MTIRWSWQLWSAVIAFQVIYGVAIFLVTRQMNQAPTVATGQEPYNYQGAAQALPPHPIPPAMPSRSTVSLPGSERITPGDAQRLLANLDSDTNTAPDVGPEELSRFADRYFREGLYRQAAAEYARVLEQAPHNVDVYNNLGLTLHYLGRGREAVETLEKGISVDDTHQRIRLTLGFVQSGLGDVSAARRSLSMAAELDPNSKVGLEAKRLLDSLP